jgi:hypothetical protein
MRWIDNEYEERYVQMVPHIVNNKIIQAPWELVYIDGDTMAMQNVTYGYEETSTHDDNYNQRPPLPQITVKAMQDNVQCSFTIIHQNELLFQIVSVNGKLLYTSPVTLCQNGYNAIRIPLSNSYSNGRYILRIFNNSATRYYPFMIVK